MRKRNSDRFEVEGEGRDAEKTLRYLQTLEAGLSAFLCQRENLLYKGEGKEKSNRDANGETWNAEAMQATTQQISCYALT